MDFNTIEKLRSRHPKRLTRGKAIKLYCKELCCCGDYQSWANCTQKSCFLWSFRMGLEENFTGRKISSKNGVGTHNFSKKQHSVAEIKPLEVLS